MARRERPVAPSRSSAEGPLGSAYLEAVPGSHELAKRLRAVWTHLTDLGQDDRPQGLDGTTKAIASSRILDHTDKEVRLYTACSVAEILRIYAPEAPFSSPILLQAFALITAQLRGLATITEKQAAAQGHKSPVLYLLHSLATVKSCIIMSELVQQDLPRAEEELVDLFDCLLKSVREDHPADVKEQMLDVLTACLSELEVIPTALLDTILLGLLPDCKAESPASYQLTQLFVSRAFGALYQPVTAFVNAVLTGKGGGGSELEEHVYHLIYELHKINPGVMLYIFPNVAIQLGAEDEGLRARAVALLGRLFAAAHAEYGQEYPRIFREFLGRFKDKEPAIRSQLVGIGAAIMQRKPRLADHIVPHLQGRLQDPEWEIRAKTVKEVCQVALKHLELVPPALVREVGERVKDRRPNVRLEAAKGLASLFAAYVSPAWSDKHRAHEPLPRDVRAKLAWIPGHLLQAYSLPDNDLRLCVLHALDEVILPREATCAARTTGLVHVWRRLGPEQRHALRVVLSERAGVQRRVQAYLAARTAWRGDMEDEAHEIRLQEAGDALVEAVPPPDRRVNLVGKLNETKDQQAARLLAVLADPRQPLPQLLKARDELAAKLGSKTQLGEYVRQLSRRAASCFATQETLADLLHLAQARMERGGGGAAAGGGDGEESEEDEVDLDEESEEEEEEGEGGQPVMPALEAVVDMVELVVETFPTLLPKALPPLLDLCWAAGRRSHARHQSAEATATAAAVQVRVLRIVTRARPRPAAGSSAASGSQSQSQPGGAAASSAPRLTAMGAKVEAELLQKFRGDVQRLCLKHGSPKAVRLGVSALCQLVPAAADPVFPKLLRELTASKALARDSPRLEAVLRALAVLAERRPRAFRAHADAVRAFVLHKLLGGRKDEGDDDEDGSVPPGVFPQLGARGGGKGKKGGAGGRKRSRELLLSDDCRVACAGIKLLVAHIVGLRVAGPASKEDSIVLRRRPGTGESSFTATAADEDDEEEEEEEDSEEDEEAGGSGKGAGAGSGSLLAVPKEELEASAGEVLDLLYQILEADGQTPDGAELSKLDRARLRLVCAAGVLKLMRNQHVQHRLLTPERWRALAWVMLDEDSDVAGAFALKLSKAVRTARVHLKFLAALSLAALEEEDDTRRAARLAVTRAVQNLRQAYEDYMGGMEDEPSEEEKRRATTSIMPEYVLPYLLHLLAHFPDFPTSHDDGARWKQLAKCMTFLLDPLMQTLGAEADNLSFLLQMTETIMAGQYRDATDGSKEAAKRLRDVTQQCRDQLRQRIKTQENLQAYPGQIYLPVSLFQLKPTGAVAPSPGGSLAEGEDGDGGGFLDDDEGPDADWGLSPIPVDVSHLGGGAGRRRRSGVRKKRPAAPAKRGAASSSAAAKGKGGKGKKGGAAAGGKRKRGRKAAAAGSSDEEDEPSSESEVEMEADGEEGGLEVTRASVRSAAAGFRKCKSSGGGAKASGGAGGKKRASAASSVFDYDEDLSGSEAGGADDDDDDAMSVDGGGDDDEARPSKVSAESQKEDRAARAAKRASRGGDEAGEGEGKGEKENQKGAGKKGKEKGRQRQPKPQPEESEESEESEEEMVAPPAAKAAKGKGKGKVAQAAATQEDDEEEDAGASNRSKRRRGLRAVG